MYINIFIHKGDKRERIGEKICAEGVESVRSNNIIFNYQNRNNKSYYNKYANGSAGDNITKRLTPISNENYIPL